MAALRRTTPPTTLRPAVRQEATLLRRLPTDDATPELRRERWAASAEPQLGASAARIAVGLARCPAVANPKEWGRARLRGGRRRRLRALEKGGGASLWRRRRAISLGRRLLGDASSPLIRGSPIARAATRGVRVASSTARASARESVGCSNAHAALTATTHTSASTGESPATQPRPSSSPASSPSSAELRDTRCARAVRLRRSMDGEKLARTTCARGPRSRALTAHSTTAA